MKEADGSGSVFS